MRSPNRSIRLSLISCLTLGLLASASATAEDGRIVVRQIKAPTTAVQAEPQKLTKAERRAKRKLARKARATQPTAGQPGVAVLPTPNGPTSFGNPQGTGQPNLVVELIANPSSPEGFPGTGYCDHNGPQGGAADTVRVRVRNEGSAQAPASTTAIHWNGGPPMTLVNTQPIAPGGGQNLYIPIPDGCYPGTAHGTCSFLIELDRLDAVDETEDDADNYDNGACMLPGT